MNVVGSQLFLSSAYRDRKQYPSSTSYVITTQVRSGRMNALGAPIVYVDLDGLPLSYIGSSWSLSYTAIILSPSTDRITRRIVVQVNTTVPSLDGFIFEYARSERVVVRSTVLATGVWDITLSEDISVIVGIGLALIRSAYARLDQTVAPTFAVRSWVSVNPPSNFFTGYKLLDLGTGSVYSITGYDSQNQRIQLSQPSLTPVISYLVIPQTSPFPLQQATAVDGRVVTLSTPNPTDVTSDALFAYNITRQLIVRVTMLDAVRILTVSPTSTAIGDRIYLLLGEEVGYPLNRRIPRDSYRCVRIECTSLIVPNAPIVSTLGSTLSGHPYLMIELTTGTSSSSYYSNTPFQVRFVCPMRDIASELESSFIRLDGGGTVHRMYIGNRDSMHIRILTADGEPLQYQISDLPDPFPPNPFAQTFASFTIVNNK